MRILNILFLLFPLLATSQPCTYLAYDGFDYPANAPLDDLNGGAGWAEPWLTQNDDKTLPGFQTSTGTGSLAFGNLQSLGRFASGGKAYLTAGRRLNTNDNGPFGAYVSEFNEGIGTQAGGTLWMSALLRKDGNNNQSVFAGLHSSGLPWCDNCTSEKVEFGYFDGQSNVAGERRWTLRIGDSYFPTAIPVDIGATTFFVVKLVFNPNATSVELYINPAELGNGSPTPVLSQSSIAPLILRSVVTYLGNDPGNGSVDEIRLANSYPCAAPDGTVTIDLPPVGIISANTNDGQAPLTIHFSGNNSFDPEGGPLSYTWSFGDGSPTVTGVSPSHTYTALGNLNVRLTVTDMAGLQHTAVYPIVVRNESGGYPCLSSFSLLKQADCDGTGGIIRINDHPDVFILKNAAGTLLTATNGSEFHNLPAGQYTYEALSNASCNDQFTLHVPIDSNTCPGWQPQLCDLSIGTNLSGFADWVPERPLRNLLKHVRPDPIAFNDDCFCWDNGNLSLIEFDVDGYPTHIPQLANGVQNKLRYVISSEGANLPPGETYVLLYDGVGNLNIGGGVTVTSNAPGRIQFVVNDAGNLFFMMNTSQMSNPMRNIRLLRLSDEAADLDAQPFYEGFLDKIRPFKVLRFMDWGATNGNPAVHWEQRSTLTHFTYATSTGVPYEMMVKLANHLKKDVWLCVPHAADSAYVAQMAALFRDELDPGLSIYLEYSNEVWNWIFAQAHFNADNAPSNLNYGRAMAERAGGTFRIWHEVFGAEKSRVKRVIGLQGGYNYLNEQILSQLDPADWDYGSPTSYIGLDHSNTGSPVLHAGSTPADIIENARSNWADFRPVLWQDYNNVKLFGKKIVNYEGGQHFVGNVFGIPYAYQQAMWDAQYSPEIHALYDDMLDTIRQWGSRMFGNFSLSSPQESVYGSWGVLNDIDVQPPYLESAPKYQALLDNICDEVAIATVEPKQELILLYPNPTSGPVWVSLPEGVPADGLVTVLDAQGRVVLRQNLGSSLSSQGFSLDLSGLASGMYLVQLIQDGKNWTAKAVLTR
jgi:PKD repeat protein